LGKIGAKVVTQIPSRRIIAKNITCSAGFRRVKQGLAGFSGVQQGSAGFSRVQQSSAGFSRLGVRTEN
jgi:hypothetical protein